MTTVLVLGVVWFTDLPIALGKPVDIRGILQQAGQAADEISEPLNQSAVVVKLAEIYRDIGDLAEAKATLARALIRARAIKGSNRIEFFTRVAKAQAQMKDVGAARVTLQEALQLQNPSVSGEISGIVRTLVEIGDIQEAFSAMDSLENAPVKDYALQSIALAQVRAGHFADASKIAERIENEAIKIEVTMAVAGAQASAGQIKNALETARVLDDTTLAKAIIHTRIALAQATAGDQAAANRSLAQARQAAGLIKTDHVHDIFALPPIAEAPG